MPVLAPVQRERDQHRAIVGSLWIRPDDEQIGITEELAYDKISRRRIACSVTE